MRVRAVAAPPGRLLAYATLLLLLVPVPSPPGFAAGPALAQAAADSAARPRQADAKGGEAADQAKTRRLEIFDRVWRLTARRYYDPDLRGVDWAAARARYAPRAAEAEDDGELAAVVNEMLGKLGSSHTHYYTDRDPAYYFLRAVFHRSLEQPIPRWDDPGFLTVRLPEGTFVSDVLDGGPAAGAGVRVGDRIVWAAGPFHPVESFEGKSGRAVAVALQSAPGAPTRTVRIVPRRISAQRAYLEATRASVRRLPLPAEKGGGEAGYIRLWTLSHPAFLEVLEQAIATLAGADGLVLDLRGGFGGQSAEYLDLFLRRGTGRMETVDRGGRRSPFVAAWEGPLVVLIDERTRSAKELLAYSLRRSGRATLVGTRTAGAVLASRAFKITDRSLLLLPVNDLLVDGKRLEGTGVRPDIVVEAPLPYRNGADPQLERALAVLAESLVAASTTGSASSTATP